jgi:hypothetical protein
MFEYISTGEGRELYRSGSTIVVAAEIRSYYCNTP